MPRTAPPPSLVGSGSRDDYEQYLQGEIPYDELMKRKGSLVAETAFQKFVRLLTLGVHLPTR